MGDCHYLDGNVKAEKMFDTVCKITELLGIEKERLRLKWISSSEGILFAETAREFTRQIQEMGPLNLVRAA